MLEKDKITPRKVINALVKEDNINAAFVRDLLQNAIIIPKPGKEQVVETATSSLIAIYKTSIKMYGEEQINNAQTESIADFETMKLIYDTLGYLPWECNLNSV